MKRLLGLYREKQYSPGRHQSNDVLLLDQIAHRLREREFAVDLLTLEEAENRRSDAAIVFSMCQGRTSLQDLAEWEKEGMKIINSPLAALNTHRDRLPALMVEAEVAFPPTHLVGTQESANLRSLDLNGGIWLKRGDVHASVTADVQWVDSIARLDAGLAEFAKRGINTAALQEHRAGDEIKFYGVAGGAFFHWFYSGEARKYPFSFSHLENLANRAAAAAGLDIFGGDVIISPSGELTLIDLNDWPSFAPCRERAAYAIADFITRRVHAA
jgi:glutathione synthase/RimK-type ligase-like ATP-grasp enzyme